MSPLPWYPGLTPGVSKPGRGPVVPPPHHLSAMPKHSHPHFDSSDPLLDAKAVATLDLHGFPAGEVESALRAFLETWKARAPGGIVHVITGRGRGSKGAPIIKSLVKIGRASCRERGRIWTGDWSSDVCSSDLPTSIPLTRCSTPKRSRRSISTDFRREKSSPR